jgi:hypothetical protein
MRSNAKPKGARANSSGTITLLVPAIVNGFPSFRDRPDLPYTFRSLMGFTSATLSPANFTVRYTDQVSGQSLVKQVSVAPRQTIEYKNVIEDLFKLPSGTKSQGPVFIDTDFNGIVYVKVYSNLPSGTLGDAFPVLQVNPIPDSSLTGASSAQTVSVDGLEQSIDLTRGTRSNLILNEALGYPVTVTVRLYESGNRSEPIAQQDVPIPAFGKVQLSTVFDGLGLNTGTDFVNIVNPRQKDRTNVLCTVTPKGGQGLVSAVVTTIDDKTADTRNSLLTPNGGSTATGVPSIGF